MPIRFHVCLCWGLLLSNIILMSAVVVADEETPPPATVGATPDVSSPLITTPDTLRKHVSYLASPELEGRGTVKGKTLALEYFQNFYEKQGFKPLFPDEKFLQDIPGKRDEEGNQPIIGKNFGVWLPGSDPKLKEEFVILSAHYDHLGIRNGVIYPGADDNASSCAMVMEVAKHLAQGKRPRRSLVILHFDLEENLLWGSRWFAAHAPWKMEQVKLFITADLLARSLGDLPMRSVFVMGSEYAPPLKDVIERAGEPDGLRVSRLGADLVGTRSDYGPFRDRKVPFLFFSTGEHPDYHTPRDLPERLDYDKLAQITTLVDAICRDVCETDTPPVWSNKPQTDLEEVRSLHRITGILLEAAEDSRPLSDLQRYLVTSVHNKTGQILERNEITADERGWMIRSAQLLLFSVF